MPRSLKSLSTGFETYMLHLRLFLEEAHEGNCWIFDLGQPDGESSIQYQVQLLCGGGSLLFVLEIKFCHLTPYQVQMFCWIWVIPKVENIAVIFEKTHIFILDEISPESLTAFSTVVIFLVECG